MGWYGGMGGTFRRLFNLYPGEEKKAGFFVILGFLWAIGGYGFLTLSEGLFLEHVGSEALPATYIGIAVAMCCLSALLLIALKRLSIPTLLVAVVTTAVVINLFLYFLLTSTDLPHYSVFWYIFKVFGWIVPISIYICFWAFVDQYFDLQDAKRFFCLFNSVIFLGDSVAGGMISFALEWLGVGGIFLFFTLILD